jgi:hypothetical protein
MPRPFQASHWKAVLPDGWQARAGGDDNGELVNIWHPEGLGQLHVLVHAVLGPPPRNTTDVPYCGSLSGYYRQEKGPSSCRRVWTLLCGDRWIWVRYACMTESYDWEDLEVDAIVQSITTNAQPAA